MSTGWLEALLEDVGARITDVCAGTVFAATEHIVLVADAERVRLALREGFTSWAASTAQVVELLDEQTQEQTQADVHARLRAALDAVPSRSARD